MNAFQGCEFVWFRPRREGVFAVEIRTLWSDLNRPPRAPEPLLAQRTSEVESYRPLEEETGLFLTFAATDSTPEGVLQFAQRYGRLGRGVEMSFHPARSSPPGAIQPGEDCEPLSRWYSHIGQLSNLCRLWDMARKGNHKALLAWSQKIAWRPIDPATHTVTMEPERDPAAFAYLFLADQFSFAMKGLLEPRIVWDKSMSRPVPKIVPVSLLGSLYLQFAYAVGEDKHYQQCSHCKKWFELAPGLNRADRLFCSDSCRVLAYRARQGQARLLAAEGKTAREIARELGSTVGTVNKWISKGKE
jgi:hypothetical protein